jgi:hypothetical protein
MAVCKFEYLGNVEARGTLRATSDMVKVERCGSSLLTSNRKKQIWEETVDF